MRPRRKARHSSQHRHGDVIPHCLVTLRYSVYVASGRCRKECFLASCCAHARSLRQVFVRLEPNHLRCSQPSGRDHILSFKFPKQPNILPGGLLGFLERLDEKRRQL